MLQHTPQLMQSDSLVDCRKNFARPQFEKLKVWTAEETDVSESWKNVAVLDLVEKASFCVVNVRREDLSVE